MAAASVPAPGQGRVDRALLSIYLSDHLAGSVAGSRRMRRTADSLRRTPVGADLDRVAQEVVDEQQQLRVIIDELGAHASVLKQVATRLAELVGRLKSNGRIVRTSPMTPLLEVELLRSAVTGKLGIWQTLHELADELDLDPARLAGLVAQTEEQIRTLDSVHRYVRARALRTHAVAD